MIDSSIELTHLPLLASSCKTLCEEYHCASGASLGALYAARRGFEFLTEFLKSSDKATTPVRTTYAIQVIEMVERLCTSLSMIDALWPGGDCRDRKDILELEKIALQVYPIYPLPAVMTFHLLAKTEQLFTDRGRKDANGPA